MSNMGPEGRVPPAVPGGGRAGLRPAGAVADQRRQGTYGEYGGRYVPETLIPALDELEAGWQAALGDAAFAAELDELGTHVRRTADATHARGALRARQAPLSQA